MDELTEEELDCLRAASKPWYKLPDSCTHNDCPLYIKLCCTNQDKNVLVVLLTDIRSSVWLEYFGESRAIHIRIKVSARETHKSTYTDLKEKEAVSKLMEDLDSYTSSQDGQATLESKSDTEMELVLHLSGLSFRLRMDKLSPESQARLLYDLVYLPLLGVVNAVQHNSKDGLKALQLAVDQESKNNAVSADPELLSAMQRFSQGQTGVPVKERVPISAMESAPVASTSRTTTTPRSSPKKPTSKGKGGTKANKDVSEEEDADKTMLSTSPEPEVKSPKSNSKRKKEKTVSPTPARNTRAATTHEAEPSSEDKSPSPPVSVKSKKKGKARQIAESPEGRDSDATQGSEEGGDMVGDDVPVVKESTTSKKGKAKELSPEEEKEEEEEQEEADPAHREETPPPAPTQKTYKGTTPTHNRDTSQPPSSPHGPILKRPPPGTARGLPPKRGKRPGMQWSNFG